MTAVSFLFFQKGGRQFLDLKTTTCQLHRVTSGQVSKKDSSIFQMEDFQMLLVLFCFAREAFFFYIFLFLLSPPTHFFLLHRSTITICSFVVVVVCFYMLSLLLFHFVHFSPLLFCAMTNGQIYLVVCVTHPVHIYCNFLKRSYFYCHCSAFCVYVGI